MFHKNLVKTKAHENNNNPSKRLSHNCDQLDIGKQLNAYISVCLKSKQ